MPTLLDRRANSFFEWNDDGHLRRYNAFTCAHGNEIVVQAPERDTKWGFCMHCMKPICGKCDREYARTGVCEPFMDGMLMRLEGLDPRGKRVRTPQMERAREQILKVVQAQRELRGGEADADLVRLLETT